MAFNLLNMNTGSSNTGHGTSHHYKLAADEKITDTLRAGYFDYAKHMLRKGDIINVFETSTGKFTRIGVVQASAALGVSVQNIDEGIERLGERVALMGLGDSRISQDSTISSTTYTKWHYGYTNWASYYSMGRFVYKDAYDKGVSGNSTTQVAARLTDIDAVQALDPDLKGVVFQCGTNDADAGVALATITGNYKTIFDYILAKGLKLYIIEEFPRNTWSTAAGTAALTLAANQKLRDINAYYKTYEATYPYQVRVIECYNDFRDGYDTVTSNSGYVSSDTVHPEVNGAMIVGRKLGQMIVSDWGTGLVPAPNKEHVVLNPYLVDDTGTDSTANLTLTGAANIPVSWTLGSSVTSGPTNTASVSRNTDGSLRLSLNCGAGGATSSLIRLEQTVTLASGAYTLDDLLQGYALIKPVSGTRFKAVGLQILDDTPGTDYTYQGMWRTNAVNYDAANAGFGLVETEEFRPQPTNTQLRLRLELTVDATTAASAVCDIYMLSIMRMERKTNNIMAYRTTNVGNVGTGTDDLMSVTLPANTLNRAGKGVHVKAWGTTANNANSKTVTMALGATTMVSTALTTSIAGVWEINATIISTGTDAQKYIASTLQGATVIVDPEQGTATIDDGAAIIIKCTGAATSDNDIVQTGMIVTPFEPL